jgi:hypothetical protein
VDVADLDLERIRGYDFKKKIEKVGGIEKKQNFLYAAFTTTTIPRNIINALQI